MRNKVCMLFGQDDLSIKNLSNILKEELYKQIEKGVNVFLVGNCGAFDNLAYEVCRQISNYCQDVEIIKVFTSISELLNCPLTIYGNGSVDRIFSTIYDIEEIEGANRLAVTNLKMVEDSDIILTFLNLASCSKSDKQIWDYAIKLKKEVVNLLGKN